MSFIHKDKVLRYIRLEPGDQKNPDRFSFAQNPKENPGFAPGRTSCPMYFNPTI